MIHSTFPECVRQELQLARQKHRPQGSAHEALAVILEEVCEFQAEVFKKSEQRSAAKMLVELVQIAAMCQRAAEDLHIDLSHEGDYLAIRKHPDRGAMNNFGKGGDA
ncbi:MAG: hypothetical protein JOZ10_16110 [Acidobacteria bacterium]|nr:hypothetical protein [Acidobacteriota bacterium]